MGNQTNHQQSPFLQYMERYEEQPELLEGMHHDKPVSPDLVREILHTNWSGYALYEPLSARQCTSLFAQYHHTRNAHHEASHHHWALPRLETRRIERPARESVILGWHAGGRIWAFRFETGEAPYILFECDYNAGTLTRRTGRLDSRPSFDGRSLLEKSSITLRVLFTNSTYYQFVVGAAENTPNK